MSVNLKLKIPKFLRRIVRRDNLIIDNQCPHCKYLNNHHKSLDCPGMNMVGMRKMAELYKSAYESSRLSVNSKNKHLSDRITYWQGKFNFIRQENNKLRKENERLRAQLKGADGAASTSGGTVDSPKDSERS